MAGMIGAWRWAVTTRLRFALIGLVVFAGGFAVTGVALPLLDGGGGGEAQPASAGQIRWTIDDARQFTEFPLYWLGESYEGLPLTKIIRYRYDPEPPIPPIEAENSVTFIYGSCTPGPESGCAPPLSIRVEPYCMKPPERIAPAVRGTPFEVRGAVAEQISGDLRIWAGEVSVKVFTEGAASQVEAVEKLRLVSEGPEGALAPLGPPTASC